MKRRAFTLVEMLVVAAIILVLAALLIPSLGRAVEMAHRTACQANIRGLTQTFNMYTSEWNSLVPYYTSSVVPNGGANQWTIPLSSGTVGDKVRQCPDASKGNPILYATGTV